MSIFLDKNEGSSRLAKTVKGDPLSYQGIKKNGAQRFSSVQKASCFKQNQKWE